VTKKSSLSTALASAAGKPTPAATLSAANAPTGMAKPASVLVAAHFSPEVRRVLKLIEADSAKNLKQLLGEAINDLADKYGKPRPYAEEG
jgi:hypothetical protein